MTNERLRRLLHGLHAFFTDDRPLSGPACSDFLETRSTLEEYRPTMFADERALLDEVDQAIVRRLPAIKAVLPQLPDAYMLRWYGESHWWWTGDAPGQPG